ncbi:MAG: hypothetical protein ACKVOK_15210 [Flavobacteriales bacterium]
MAILCLYGTVDANVYTVNNQVGFDADFDELNQAITSATAGDTLYVEPSSISYGAITLNKLLYIIGPGHNPDFSPYNASLSSLTFTTNSSSSVVKGLSLGVINNPSSTVINDVVVSGCYIFAQNPFGFSSNGTTLNNWIFEGNVFLSQSNGISLNGLGANIIFRNNYLQIYAGSNIMVNVPSGTVFDHNLFVASDNTGFSSVISSGYSNIVITNNIVLVATTASSPVEAGCGACLWENNLTYGVTIPLSALPGSNINDVNPDFANYIGVNGGYNYANDFHLDAGSVGENAATDGSDIGLYGGIFPFSSIGADSGTPQIVDFTIATSTAPSGGTITIHLNANGSGQ